eukprot:6274317-Heterocapsa_arctica.AAC.1
MVKKDLKMFAEIGETMVAHLRRHIEKLNDKQISLKEYMDYMKEGQNNINQRVLLQAEGARRQEAKVHEEGRPEHPE